jgi:hypothetical protein
MTMDEVDGLYRYWRRNPPLVDLVAAYLGFKPKTEAEAAAHPSIAMIRARYPDGIVRG